MTAVMQSRFFRWSRVKGGPEKGQALAEYAMLIAVAAVLAVAMFSALAGLSDFFPGGIAGVLTGDEVPPDETGYGPRIAD